MTELEKAKIAFSDASINLEIAQIDSLISEAGKVGVK